MTAPEEAPLRSGIFAQNEHGCLTILRDEPSEGFVSISFTPNDETSVADFDAQTMSFHAPLFDKALELAGYTAQPPKGRRRQG